MESVQVIVEDYKESNSHQGTKEKSNSSLHINAFKMFSRSDSVPLVIYRALFCSKISHLLQIKRKQLTSH